MKAAVSARLAALAAATILAGCSGEPAAENNQAVAAVNDQSAEMNAMTADPNNPYARSEMQMGERMMAAIGQNAAETWVRKMIEHHRGAIAMVEILEGQGGDARVLEKARETAAKQRRELQELERMLAGGVSGNAPANPYEQGERRAHERMMAATGANPSETWLRKMIEHHRGGVEMSEIVIAQGGNPEVKEMARRSAAEQRRDIAALERLLGGEDAAAGSEGARPGAGQPKAASQPKAAPAAPVRPSARTETPRPAPKAEQPADPHAGHDMNNMANMSH